MNIKIAYSLGFNARLAGKKRTPERSKKLNKLADGLHPQNYAIALDIWKRGYDCAGLASAQIALHEMHTVEASRIAQELAKIQKSLETEYYK